MVVATTAALVRTEEAARKTNDQVQIQHIVQWNGWFKSLMSNVAKDVKTNLVLGDALLRRSQKPAEPRPHHADNVSAPQQSVRATPRQNPAVRSHAWEFHLLPNSRIESPD